MAGIPPEEAERFLVRERIDYDATDCPVRYEVWREYALNGPQARPHLLLERATERQAPGQSSDAHATQTGMSTSDLATEIARRLRRARARQPDVDQPQPRAVTISLQEPGQPPRPFDEPPTDDESGTESDELALPHFGDWIVIEPNLVELVMVVLPLTTWNPVLRAGLAQDERSLARIMEPPTARRALTPLEGARPVDPRVSWLFRFLGRLWGWDPDLAGERLRGAQWALKHLGEVHLAQQGLEPNGVRDLSGYIASVNFDRTVSTAVSYSGRTVKADVARKAFHIDCSHLTWAVIDSGIDARHPAFRAWGKDEDEPFRTRVVKTLDFTRIKMADFTALQRGDDFVNRLERTIGIAAPTSAEDESGYTAPTNSHGTHVAGILAGNWSGAEDHQDVRGVCPDLKLWDLRVVGESGDGLESRLLMALQYIREVNAQGGEALQVAGVNLSLSVPYNPRAYACGWTPVCQEARRLVRSGVVVVAAAGNSGFDQTDGGPASAGTGFQVVGITDPGNAAEVITVGATHRFQPDRYGASFFSSKGPTADGRLKPDLLAPGEGIYSAVGRKDFAAKDGTSQAAPHVSGAAALLIGRNSELLGEPERVKHLLVSSATDLGRDRNFQGSGLLDVFRALQAL
jgi:hypothetical protein